MKGHYILRIFKVASLTGKLTITSKDFRNYYLELSRKSTLVKSISPISPPSPPTMSTFSLISQAMSIIKLYKNSSIIIGRILGAQIERDPLLSAMANKVVLVFEDLVMMVLGWNRAQYTFPRWPLNHNICSKESRVVSLETGFPSRVILVLTIEVPVGEKSTFL